VEPTKPQPKSDQPPSPPNEGQAASPADQTAASGAGDGAAHPAQDQYKIASAELPGNIKKSRASKHGVSSWFQVNHRAINVGIVAGALALILGSVATYFGLQYFRKPPKTGFETQKVDPNDLEKLSSDQLPLDKPGQILTILADGKFKNNLDVDGKLSVVGDANLVALNLAQNLSVAGTTVLGGATVNNILSVRGGLNVTGNSSFAGDLSVGSLSVRSAIAVTDLTINGHVITGGNTPSAVTDVGAGGGTVQVAGNDSTGTITISTGAVPIAGTLARINFRSPYGSVPTVIITPIGSAAAKLEYYTIKSGDFFTIESASLPNASTTYTFDYFVVQ
jgi:hypothetical protein